jgi:methionyl-tRNA formyltransferase
MENKIKTIFIGTPEFAIPSLKILISDPEIELALIITQPDKKIGRKQILTPPRVKIFAQAHNLPVIQPEKISEIEPLLYSQAPDIIIVAAYAQLIPKSILNMPKYGCINVHGSLLPKYRGSSCIQAAILNNDIKTGITIMLMGEKLDNGPILAQAEIKIENNDTAGSLYNKLSALGAEILLPTIKALIKNEIRPVHQNESLASYAKELKKTDGKINWQNSAEYLERFVRAMQPWPGAWTNINIADKNLTLRIIEVKIENIKNNLSPGEIFLTPEGLAVKCEQNALLILKLQLEGKREISGAEFLRGHKNIGGQIL